VVKNQVVSPVKPKTRPKVKKTIGKKVKTAPQTTKSTALTKPRSTRSQANTLSYYNCLTDQVANPLNEKVKITALCRHCKHNKGKVEATKQAEKQTLIKQVAQDYLAFGKSLGSLLHTDITCGCKKELVPQRSK